MTTQLANLSQPSDQDVLPDAGLIAPSRTTPLKFITCGSVDDGKSTLIGRLLWDIKAIHSDQSEALEKNAAKGTDQQIEYAHLLDGLAAEREQGITIDVAYRYFSTPKRSFIIADTPGHVQYTRNMATGCSQANLAILLVDARTGLVEQTKRHLSIGKLMGIEQFILVINKMDLVEYNQHYYHTIKQEFCELMFANGIKRFDVVPASALKGENIAHSAKTTMPWYQGKTVLTLLEEAPSETLTGMSFRFPVQRVSRPDESFRGYQGTIVGGAVKPGDEVKILPSGQYAIVKHIVTYDLIRNAAVSNDAVTLVLDKDVDVSRGDMFVSPSHPSYCLDQFKARLVWLSETPYLAHKRYLIHHAHKFTKAQLLPKKRLNLEKTIWEENESIIGNQISEVEVSADENIAFDKFEDNHTTGSFIVVDPESYDTVAAGVIINASDNIRQLGSNHITISLPEDIVKSLLAHPDFQHLEDYIR